MIRQWLKRIFTEAWQDYESSFPGETTARRNPSSHDVTIRHRKGHRWTNMETKQSFYLDLVWKKKAGRKKGKKA